MKCLWLQQQSWIGAIKTKACKDGCINYLALYKFADLWSSIDPGQTRKSQGVVSPPSFRESSVGLGTVWEPACGASCMLGWLETDGVGGEGRDRETQTERECPASSRLLQPPQPRCHMGVEESVLDITPVKPSGDSRPSCCLTATNPEWEPQAESHPLLELWEMLTNNFESRSVVYRLLCSRRAYPCSPVVLRGWEGGLC